MEIIVKRNKQKEAIRNMKQKENLKNKKNKTRFGEYSGSYSQWAYGSAGIWSQEPFTEITTSDKQVNKMKQIFEKVKIKRRKDKNRTKIDNWMSHKQKQN